MHNLYGFSFLGGEYIFAPKGKVNPIFNKKLTGTNIYLQNSARSIHPRYNSAQTPP